MPLPGLYNPNDLPSPPDYRKPSPPIQPNLPGLISFTGSGISSYSGVLPPSPAYTNTRSTSEPKKKTPLRNPSTLGLVFTPTDDEAAVNRALTGNDLGMGLRPRVSASGPSRQPKPYIMPSKPATATTKKPKKTKKALGPPTPGGTITGTSNGSISARGSNS